MGRPWSLVIMPLLSTLAALVILAHSAEEEVERGLLHHETSPRLSEPGSPDYDQSWRAVEVQPLIQQNPEPPDEWGAEIATQEPPKRRRPGRKRKRRPQQTYEEDLLTEEHRPYARGLDDETAVHENAEPMRRRRKRPEARNPNRWNVEFEEQRPLRRRGQRRKRPVTSIEPEDVRTEELSTITQEHHEQESYHNDNMETHSPSYLDEPNKEHITTDFTTDFREKQRDSRSESGTTVDTIVSEQSIVEEIQKEDITTNEKHDKSYRIPYSLARKPEPPTGEKSIIKELLKQSGGLSLSELLQQRNLSLSDLLNGKQNAISALKSDSTAVLAEDIYKEGNGANHKSDYAHTEEIVDPKDVSNIDEITTTAKYNTVNTPSDETLFIKPIVQRIPVSNNKSTDNRHESELSTKENPTTLSPRRRLPPGSLRNIRKRIRNPQVESSTSRKRMQYNFMSSHSRRRENVTTTVAAPVQETENLVESETVNVTTKRKFEEPITTITTTTTTEEPTTVKDLTTTFITTTVKLPQPEQANTEPSEVVIKSEDIEKPKLLIPALRPKLLATNSELRRQAQNNRQRKRLRNKVVIPNDAQEIAVQDLFGMANLISASEFITKIQTTQQPTSTTTTTTTTDIPDLFTDNNEDIDSENIVSEREKPTKVVVRKIEIKLPKYTTVRNRISSATAKTTLSVTTEESAKREILEVLKDMQGGARLAKILLERNMTINELVEHRERGSSQIHLADIFHNASREPNPPEPFLSKSLIEPISKETYPLRALLDSNNYDPALKMPTQNPYVAQYTNIPLIVDYGKNIHENGENLGIVALFNEFTNKAKYEGHTNLKKDSEGTAYFTSVMSLNTTDDNFREGRMAAATKPEVPTILPHLQNLMEKAHQIHTIPTTQGTTTMTVKSYAEKDVDGDGLIILEDLQRLKELDNNIAQAINEKLEVKTFEDSQTEEAPKFLGKFPSGVRSATIVSASIAGATMIVFLVTYIGYKWRQSRKSLLRNNSFRNERIPTPVFENRKSNRNCSTRSISPMLASSNGFTMNTLDSQTGKESPDYMWDTLHKPFQ